MFLRRTRGLLDFIVAALCLWAAAYHTPVGALARNLGAWAMGTRSTAQPLLAYYSGGVYDANEVKVSMAPPSLIVHPVDLTPGEAVGYGVYSTWSQLGATQKKQGLQVALRYGGDVTKLDDPKEGPAELSRILREAAKGMESEEAAVAAVFLGYEPARYAADRVRASGAVPTLEGIARVLPPGFSEELSRASQALTLGTAYALAWPVPESTRITSPFGWRDHPVLGRQSLHTGVDLGVPVGTEVHVVAAGMVRRASEDAVNGRVLIIDHGRGVTTAYCHNSQLGVQVGQSLERGQVISLSGNTGRSTGPHLHYQLELGSAPMDPLLFRARRSEPVAVPGPKTPKAVPALYGKATGERRVDLVGRGFPPRTKLAALVNDSVRNASVTCNKEFSKPVETDDKGAFAVTLSLPQQSPCSFACAADASPLLLFAKAPDGTERQ
ncbi:MAG: M23 family metallopeptidase, partial [Myxococcaceae bacterium]